MRDEIPSNDQDIEIDIAALLKLIKKKIWIILTVAIICAFTAGVCTEFMMEKMYSSTTRLYPKPEVTEGLIDYTQLNANNLLINNYVAMMKGNNIQGQAAKMLGLDRSYLRSVVSVTNVTDTQIMSITATTTDPVLSKKIVDALAEVFTKEAQETLEIRNITVVDEAEVATTHSSPSIKKNAALGFIGGAFLTVFIIFMKFMLDTRIHNREELETYLGIPALGVLYEFDSK